MGVLDLGRREHASATFWVHGAAMPGINLFDLVAYLQERQRNPNG